MSKDVPIWKRVATDPLYKALAKRIGWVGFPARELFDKIRDIVQEHGAPKVAAALCELVTWTGNRIMIQAGAKKSCRVLLGPEPHEQVEIYRKCDPAFRPDGWDRPPEIPKGGPDPLMEGLYRLTGYDLEHKLKLARQNTRLHPDEPSEVGAVESEFIRRGMEIPPEDPSEMKPAEAKPKRAKGRKVK